MAEIININDKQSKEADGDGSFKAYNVVYRFDNKNWIFTIYARSFKEANMRVSDIKHFPVEVSELVEEFEL